MVENESYRMSTENNHYQLLDISPNASMEEIKEAYFKLAFRYHPDRNQMSLTSNKIMEKINEAYSTLSDPIKRREYDIPGVWCNSPKIQDWEQSESRILFFAL